MRSRAPRLRTGLLIPPLDIPTNATETRHRRPCSVRNRHRIPRGSPSRPLQGPPDGSRIPLATPARPSRWVSDPPRGVRKALHAASGSPSRRPQGPPCRVWIPLAVSARPPWPRPRRGCDPRPPNTSEKHAPFHPAVATATLGGDPPLGHFPRAFSATIAPPARSGVAAATWPPSTSRVLLAN